MGVKKKLYGKTPDGQEVYSFTLSNSKGMIVKILNYGGIISSIVVPDRYGKFEDVVLGYDKIEDYIKNKLFFGAIIGRHANRIENGKFKINGTEYILSKNEGNNQLHGGMVGFDKVIWNAEITQNGESEAVELCYFSLDGDEGYPGNLDVKVTYTLTEDNTLEIDYFAVSDKDTVVNLTNHSYFNLLGHGAGDILKHQVMINSDKFTVNNKNSIPTGEIKSVKETSMDFTKLTPIDQGIFDEYDQIKFGKGYDNNWILNVSGQKPEKAAEVFEASNGRVMEVYTTKPGVQFYTGNNIYESHNCKDGSTYNKYSGLCLETQYLPNLLKYKHFPSSILKCGEKYRHKTLYKFSTR
ncbi:aldose epimerase family protein [Clostridium uliginosum]|uniref:Aldose 1-epimerase n=1 Tax=Clostridium uliginosum TaxID=119641 RepID=A0A1I1HXG3_9CLOT|nr:aldose epimerase family protein [Clostridium uliginosum]SFC28531.1 aldose 1-epimerase [Clostridium uliginosum]